MEFNLFIAMDNDAFAEEPGNELAVLLRKVAKAVEFQSFTALDDEGTRPILDTNGNTVGTWNVREVEVSA